MLEMIGKCGWLFWGCFGTALGRYGRRYVEDVRKAHDCRAGFRLVQPPFFELINGLLWGITVILYEQMADKIIFGLLCSVLLGIAVIDFSVFEIPPELNGIIVCLGILRIATDLQHWSMYITGSLLGGGIFLLVYLVTGKRGIGGGDVKLMAAAGLLLGPEKIFLALFLGCVSAVVVELPRKYKKKKNSTFALGPYLAFGIGVAVWFGDKIIQWKCLPG